jgi:hypothetical protein
MSLKKIIMIKKNGNKHKNSKIQYLNKITISQY